MEDTGCGIPEDELARIFDRFYTGGRRPSDRPPGTGLGLAITRRLLELHGSDISVVSEVGVGSAFSFRLATARGTAVLPSP